MKNKLQDAFNWVYLNKDPYHSGESAGKWFAEVNTQYRGPDFGWGWGFCYLTLDTNNEKVIDTQTLMD